MSTVKEITPQELYKKFLSGEHPNLVDVRNPTSYGEWNIFTSHNLPYSKVMALQEEKDFPFKILLHASLAPLVSKAIISRFLGPKIIAIETCRPAAGGTKKNHN